VIQILAAFLFAWEPVRVARELTTTLGSFGMRGAPAVVEILAHGAVAALAMAGGQALWNRNPAGPGLAAVAIAASVVADVQSLYWSSLPGQTMPGDRAPLAILAIANGAWWLGYLRWSAGRQSTTTSSSRAPSRPRP
jgi:hypothetical protein